MTRRLLFFVADGFQALDLFGPLDAFMETNSFVANAYDSKILGLTKSKVSTSHGQLIYPDVSLDNEFTFDDLIICGGAGMRTLRLSVRQLKQLQSLAKSAKRVMSICTGAFVLAKLFPNKDLAMTSHRRYCTELSLKNPDISVFSEPLYVKSGNKWTSAGVLSGVDLALAIIREDHGNAIAVKVAKELVVYVQRSGSQNQFSDILQVQSAESLRLSPLIDRLNQQIDKTISVNEMANYIGLSERQVSRLFKLHLDCTPSHFFKKLKLNYARDLLGRENISVEQVSRKVGFNSYDSFRRAFVRHFSLSPTAFSRGVASHD